MTARHNSAAPQQQRCTAATLHLNNVTSAPSFLTGCLCLQYLVARVDTPSRSNTTYPTKAASPSPHPASQLGYHHRSSAPQTLAIRGRKHHVGLPHIEPVCRNLATLGSVVGAGAAAPVRR